MQLTLETKNEIKLQYTYSLCGIQIKIKLANQS